MSRKALWGRISQDSLEKYAKDPHPHTFSLAKRMATSSHSNVGPEGAKEGIFVSFVVPKKAPGFCRLISVIPQASFIRDDPTATTTIFGFISRGPIFHFWGTPGWRTKWPLYTVEHREPTKSFHLMCHQMPFWCGIRCKTFVGKLWLWLCLGRP